MKTIPVWIAAVAVAVLGVAFSAQAGVGVAEISVSSIPTNGAGVSTNMSSVYVLGEIKSIQFSRSGNTAGATNAFYVYAYTNGSYATKTIALLTNVADVAIAPTATAVGQSIRFPVISQQIQVLAQNANQTGITAIIYVIYEAP